jgi:hypothetical protein
MHISSFIVTLQAVWFAARPPVRSNLLQRVSIPTPFSFSFTSDATDGGVTFVGLVPTSVFSRTRRRDAYQYIKKKDRVKTPSDAD